MANGYLRTVSAGNSKLLSQFFDGDFVVGVDTNFTGNFHGFLGNLSRRELGVVEEGGCGRCCIGASAADSGNTGVRLDDVSLTADQERLRLVGNQQQGFELSEHLVGTPV